MTQQSCDVVEVAGESFDLAEADDGWAGFDADAHGLPLTFVGSDCWHGFVCVYRVEELLLLDAVSIGWSKAFARGGGPELFGRRARRVRDGSQAWARYESLQQPVAFTGSLLVGRGGRPHGGLTPAAYTYETVVELVFVDGRLCGRSDVTSEMERYRQAYEAWMLRPKPQDDGWLRSEEGFAAARRQYRAYARFFGSRRREAEETS